jgi:hypothetical protein
MSKNMYEGGDIKLVVWEEYDMAHWRLETAVPTYASSL